MARLVNDGRHQHDLGVVGRHFSLVLHGVVLAERQGSPAHVVACSGLLVFYHDVGRVIAHAFQVMLLPSEEGVLLLVRRQDGVGCTFIHALGHVVAVLIHLLKETASRLGPRILGDVVDLMLVLVLFGNRLGAASTP